jgi:YidC/Oxa1 family membrane protein insertase
MIMVSMLIGACGGVLIGMGLWRFWQWNALYALCVGIVYGIVLGYWWEWSTLAPQVKKAPAEAYIPASERELSQQLMTDIDFRDRDIPPSSAHEIAIETPHMRVVFEEYGAVIKKMVHKRLLNGTMRDLTLWDIDPFSDREQGAFLVACDKDTPLAYRLVGKEFSNGIHTVRFSVEGNGYVFEKEFVIHEDSYRIEFNLKVGNVTRDVRPRILFPAPYLSDLTRDTVQVLACSQFKAIKKYAIADAVGRAWESPTLFGVEDRYFVVSMIHDNNGFTNRAYTRPQDVHRANAILESRILTKAKNFALAFYCGPKERYAMELADPRLLDTLNYGWLTPVSTTLFGLLMLVYRFIGNYGWAIIILAILLKLLMLPFMSRAEQSQRKMAEMQRKLQAIDRKYKDDVSRRDYERAELVKQHGFGGLFGSGLLIHISRFVIFFGLNRVLSVAIELYQAPFLWVHDLAGSDPYYILPVFAGIGTFITMRKATDARQIVTVVMVSMIIMGVMVNLAAGVVLYLAVSTWLDIVQQYFQRNIRHV